MFELSDEWRRALEISATLGEYKDTCHDPEDAMNYTEEYTDGTDADPEDQRTEFDRAGFDPTTATDVFIRANDGSRFFITEA